MAKKNDNSSSEALREHIEKVVGKDFRKMRKVLRQIIDGKRQDLRVFKPKVKVEDEALKRLMATAEDYGFILVEEIPSSNKDVISACKELKVLILDKVLADVKDTQKHEHKFDMTDAIQEVARRKQAEAEAKLEREGKLKKIGS